MYDVLVIHKHNIRPNDNDRTTYKCTHINHQCACTHTLESCAHSEHDTTVDTPRACVCVCVYTAHITLCLIVSPTAQHCCPSAGMTKSYTHTHTCLIRTLRPDAARLLLTHIAADCAVHFASTRNLWSAIKSLRAMVEQAQTVSAACTTLIARRVHFIAADSAHSHI
jgi:hypothetical protein